MKIELATVEHIAFRLPNWLGDICMAIPVIKAIQAKAKTHNPSVQFSLLMQPHFLTLIRKLGIEGNVISLPQKNWKYFFRCMQWRGKFDMQIMFTNSERGDFESWLMKTPMRLGVSRSKKPREFLTHHYALSKTYDEESIHQTMLWRDFTAHFGLHEGLDLRPLARRSPKSKRVGLICGSANTPAKRWSVENWHILITKLLNEGVDEILLLGARDDMAVCEQVKAVTQDERLINLAGKTNLTELVDILRIQSLVIGNDTGGIHLANALGVPVIGLYGLTNPVRSRPIHDAALSALQSPKGYGEGKMEDILVEQVVAVANTFIANHI